MCVFTRRVEQSLILGDNDSQALALLAIRTGIAEIAIKAPEGAVFYNGKNLKRDSFSAGALKMGVSAEQLMLKKREGLGGASWYLLNLHLDESVVIAGSFPIVRLTVITLNADKIRFHIEAPISMSIRGSESFDAPISKLDAEVEHLLHGPKPV